MPRFYFDTDDGLTAMRDIYGVELADEHAARDLALMTLPDMAQQTRPEGDHQTIAVYVRDEGDQPIIEVTLKLEVEWK